MNKKRPFISGMIIGGVVGAVAALFMAPKSGKELRQDLRKWYSLMEKDVDKAMQRVKTVSQSSYQAAVDAVTTTYSKVKELSTEDLDTLRLQLLSRWNKDDKKAKSSRKK